MPIDFPHELLEDRVLILPDPTEEKTSTGVYMPQSAQRRSTKGTVMAVGNGIHAIETGVLINMWVKKGDRVTYTKHEFEDCDFEGFENYIIGRETSIKCILHED